MGPEPQESPAESARSGVPIQLRRSTSDVDERVPESWLREREHLSAAERVDRLAADYDLITRLALAGFQGRDYDYFATELAKAAWPSSPGGCGEV